jgi:ribosome biogenesis protein BMS1
MSDIVFLRAWYPVQPKKFYNPVTSLLLSKKEKWTGMRTAGQIRRDESLSVPVKKDSEYKVIFSISNILSLLYVLNDDSTN